MGTVIKFLYVSIIIFGYVLFTLFLKRKYKKEFEKYYRERYGKNNV